MRRLVELTALTIRRDQRDGSGVMGKLAPHLEAVVVSQNTYDLASRTMPEILKQATALAKTALGEESPRLQKIEKRVDALVDRIDTARSLVEIYRPYLQELRYTFHCRNIRELYARLPAADAAIHP